jgi:hypothetical protein
MIQVGFRASACITSPAYSTPLSIRIPAWKAQRGLLYSRGVRLHTKYKKPASIQPGILAKAAPPYDTQSRISPGLEGPTLFPKKNLTRQARGTVVSSGGHTCHIREHRQRRTCFRHSAVEIVKAETESGPECERR